MEKQINYFKMDEWVVG